MELLFWMARNPRSDRLIPPIDQGYLALAILTLDSEKPEARALGF